MLPHHLGILFLPFVHKAFSFCSDFCPWNKTQSSSLPYSWKYSSLCKLQNHFFMTGRRNITLFNAKTCNEPPFHEETRKCALWKEKRWNWNKRQFFTLYFQMYWNYLMITLTMKWVTLSTLCSQLWRTWLWEWNDAYSSYWVLLNKTNSLKQEKNKYTVYLNSTIKYASVCLSSTTDKTGNFPFEFAVIIQFRNFHQNIITMFKKIILSKCDFFFFYFAILYDSGKIQKDGRKESCKPILKVEYKTSRNRWVLSNKFQDLDYMWMCPDCTFSALFMTL